MMHGPGRTEPLRRIRSDAGNATASSAPPRILAVGALLCCAFSGLFGAAEGAASETAADEDPRHAEEPAIDEEVVVRGRQRSVLRAELRLAEEALYSRFNEINSRDEFDVHCRNEKPMNSQIPRRVCVPRFWTETHASIGRDAFLWITEGYSGSADPYLVHAQTKQALFDEELRRLAAEDEELQRALARYASLKRTLDGQDPIDAAAIPTVWSERTSDDGSLPYDAARIVSIEIGDAPWS